MMPRHRWSSRIMEKEEEEEEEDAAEPKPTGSWLNNANLEKPTFSSSVKNPKFCVPFELGGVDGDNVPYTINRYLRDYQREGIRFIYNNYIRSRGCILGDDMGLGKTVQVIGFLAAVLQKTGTWDDIENNKPQFLQSQILSKQHRRPKKVFLIVSPLSVLYNWKDELDTWGYFQYVMVHGLRKEDELARIKNGRIEIALTTYETLRLCLDQFNNVGWSAVFVDEVHKLKNPNSQVTQAMKNLKCQVRIGLTGTILQNNLEELWCVMDWAIPGCLGSLGHFKNKFSDPVEQGQRHSATKRALATARKTVRALVRKISRWFLRRTKALIKDQLPKKDDRVVYCSLTDFQQAVYQTVLDSEDVKLLLASSEKCVCRSGRSRRSCCYKTNSEGAQMKELYFSYLALLRKISNHVALLQFTPGTSKKQEKHASAVCRTVFQKFPDLVRRCKDEPFEALSDPVYSGKMKVLQKLLKYYLQRRDKVLLFSLSTKLLDVLESYCMAEGLDYSRLDGSTKSKERFQIVKEFNQSTHINLCLVSTMAGGVGLNFVGASVVVLFDPTWNPANDLQAIDRAYRIGQCKDVTVFRLISLGTIEEIIYLRQVYKQQLGSTVVGEESARRYFEAVQGRGAHKGELFGIKNLFRLQTEGTCLTRKILEREGQVEAGVMTASTHGGEEREEEAARVSEPDGSPPTNAPAGIDQPVKETRETSSVRQELLDFSSGSEEDEDELGMGSGNARSGNAEGGSSLLKHGFSRLLQRVQANPESDERDSSSGDDESAVRRDGRGDTLSRLVDQKVVEDHETSPDRKRPENLSSKDSKGHFFDCYSDESEDLDMEDLGCRSRGPEKPGGRNGKSQSAKKKKARSESKETFFTSSEEEHSAVQRGGSGECQTDGSKGGISKDGEGAAKRVKMSSEEQAGPSGETSYTDLKGHTPSASRRTGANIDSVLGGVEGVMFTHSNQRVVGGSRAEELISRAAVRDVFERRMHSQLPANRLFTQLESLLSGEPGPAIVTAAQTSADRPVSVTRKSVHESKDTTVIVGETPKAVRRQQLEEMAAELGFSSVRRFALDVVRSSSGRRTEWLKRYYASLGLPDVTDVVAESFAQTDSARASSSSATISKPSSKAVPDAAAAAVAAAESETGFPQKVTAKAKRCEYRPKRAGLQAKAGTQRNRVSVPLKEQDKPRKYVPEPQKKQSNAKKNVLESGSDVPSPESEEREEGVRTARRHKRTKRASVSSCGALEAGGGLGVDQASGGGLGPAEAAPVPTHRDADTGFHPDLSQCQSTALSEPVAQPRQKSSSAGGESFQGQKQNLADLLGDTSVLDDLFKPKLRGAPRSSSFKSTSASVAKSGPAGNVDAASSGGATKRKSRDIWDILNEGSEESICRLTDLGEVQRACASTTAASRTRPGETDGKSLWKTNEKFLWKM